MDVDSETNPQLEEEEEELPRLACPKMDMTLQDLFPMTFGHVPSFVLINLEEQQVDAAVQFDGSKYTPRRDDALQDLSFRILLLGGTVRTQPETDYAKHIPLIYVTNDKTFNSHAFRAWQQGEIRAERKRDAFHEDFIRDIFHRSEIGDLMEYRIGASMFEPYDGRQVLSKEHNWNRMKLLTPIQSDSSGDSETVYKQSGHAPRQEPKPKSRSGPRRTSTNSTGPSPSPGRRSPSTRRRSPSPRRSPSTRRRSPSPRRSPSTRRRSPSPRPSPSTRRRSPSTRRRSRSPRPSPSTRRSRSPRPSPSTRRRSPSPRPSRSPRPSTNLPGPPTSPRAGGSRSTIVCRTPPFRRVPDPAGTAPNQPPVAANRAESSPSPSPSPPPRDPSVLNRGHAGRRGGAPLGPKKPLISFTEQRLLLDYVIRRNEYDRLTSKNLYVEMQNNRVIPHGRTYQTLMNHFKRVLLRRDVIATHNLGPVILANFRPYLTD